MLENNRYVTLATFAIILLAIHFWIIRRGIVRRQAQERMLCEKQLGLERQLPPELNEDAGWKSRRKSIALAGSFIGSGNVVREIVPYVMTKGPNVPDAEGCLKVGLIWAGIWIFLFYALSALLERFRKKFYKENRLKMTTPPTE